MNAKLSEVKDNLSRYVERVRRGERVRIFVRGAPAADLVPVEAALLTAAEDEAMVADLERRGLVRRGRGGIPAEILKPGPRLRGPSLVDLVSEERRRGR